jgi:hypothetical protein
MLFTISCTTVHPITSDDLTGPNPPRQVKVTLADDRSVVVLHDPHVTGDTLVGSAKGARQAILLSDVYGMTDKQGSAGKTALLVLGGGAAAALFTGVILSNGGPPGEGTRCCPGCNYLVSDYNGVPVWFC